MNHHQNHIQKPQFTNDTCKTICHNLYKKVFKLLLIPFEQDDCKIKTGIKSHKDRKARLINLLENYFEDLEFNQYQMALTVCYADKFLSKMIAGDHCILKQINFLFLKSVLILSITVTHKMTCDFVFSNSSLETKLFKISNLGQLEDDYYELVDYNFFVPFEDVLYYLSLLLK